VSTAGGDALEATFVTGSGDVNGVEVWVGAGGVRVADDADGAADTSPPGVGVARGSLGGNAALTSGAAGGTALTTLGADIGADGGGDAIMVSTT
jgi:hypothetical protein